jgi:hypothetical protein
MAILRITSMPQTEIFIAATVVITVGGACAIAAVLGLAVRVFRKFAGL